MRPTYQLIGNNGMFASRDTVNDALDYIGEMFAGSGYSAHAVTATFVYHNTLANVVNKQVGNDLHCISADIHAALDKLDEDVQYWGADIRSHLERALDVINSYETGK